MADVTLPPEIRQQAIEALARKLWQIGNARIGHREWSQVAEVYLAEAAESFDAVLPVIAARCPKRRIEGDGPDYMYRCVYHAGHEGPCWSWGTKWWEIDPEPGSDTERALIDRVEKAEAALSDALAERDRLRDAIALAQQEQTPSRTRAGETP